MDDMEEQSKCGEYDSENEEDDILKTAENIRICLVGELAYNEKIYRCALEFNVPIVTSKDGVDVIKHDTSWKNFFILNNFDGSIYDTIYKTKQRILGPPALQEAALLKQAIPCSRRPLYNHSMKGVIICFTGIRKENELRHLVALIYSMGGSIRKDVDTKVTHLICNSVRNSKYQYGIMFRLEIVKSDWIYESWKNRDNIFFKSTNSEFTKIHTLKPFDGHKICLLSFPEEECAHMSDILKDNSGIVSELEDPECTHLVVDEHLAQTNLKLTNPKAHIVISAWFWYTIQNGYADEKEFLFDNYLHNKTIIPVDSAISLYKRKRKRGSQVLQSEDSPNSSAKRSSSVSSAGALLSISDSFLDFTVSSDKSEIVADQSLEIAPLTKSMRYHYFTEFCYTESNYVGILETIVNLFKNPLEKKSESGDELLNKSEIKLIFGNFTPIYQVHKKILENLQKIQLNWCEDCLIGEIITEEHDKLIKVYPPYVNFFQKMKETLMHCDRANSRFHAFLKINQAKPECSRQSLQELMIRPVQRLPSISLLLIDILKHTNKLSPDYIKLEEALVSIKEVMTHINEDKRKTDNQLDMLDIVNDIEDCPAQLGSSHRSFISKCEVTELSDTLSGRRDTLLLYLFSDSIELCKRRSKSGFITEKSPSSAKTFKHIQIIPLSTIKYIIEISDSQRGFAVRCRLNEDLEDKLYSFVILNEQMDRSIYLKTICKQIVENACNTENPFISMSSQELNINISNISDVNQGPLSKAFKFATETKSKVSRAFSFNKTPTKLKRALSTIMMSPRRSINSLTPLSHRLPNGTNLNEVDEEMDCNNGTKSEILITSTPIKPP